MANLSSEVLTLNSTFAEYTSFPKAVQTFLMIYYIVIFTIGFVGNILIVISVVKFKHLKTVVNIFLANLAIADVLFVVLSLFDATQFILQRWVFGDILCRLQSTAIEVSYTVSVVTLATVAVERYLSICHPHRKKRNVRQSIHASIFIWIFAILFCGVLAYGYHSREEKGRYKCLNDHWSKQSRLIFYIVHSLIVYFLPLLILCFSHYKISGVLEKQRQRSHDRLGSRPNSNIQVTRNNMSNFSESDGNSTRLEDIPSQLSSNCLTTSTGTKKQSKNLRILTRRSNIIGLLVVITSIFLILWSPFIVVRLLMYADVKFNEVIFRASQLLVFTNTAVNFIVYALMCTSFRRAFKGLFTCGTNDDGAWNISGSKSLDISETLKKSFSFNKPVAKDDAILNE